MDASSRRMTILGPMMSQLLRTCGPAVPNDSGTALTKTLLVALGACLATTYTTKAAAQGVKVDGLGAARRTVEPSGAFRARAGAARAKRHHHHP